MKVINVLSPEMYADCRIKGSINVPLNDLARFVKDLPRNTPMVVYCTGYSCPLSLRAALLLKDLGFIKVRAYEGGVAEWHSLGYPSEGPALKDYLKEKHEKSSTREKVETITAQQLKKEMGL